MPKYKGSDGFIYETDDSGNIISRSQDTSQQGFLDRPRDIISQESAGPLIPESARKISPREIISKAISSLRYPADALAVAGGTAVAGPAGGVGFGTAVDLAFQNFEEREGLREPSMLGPSFGLEEGSPQEKLFSAGEALTMNEFGGIIGNKLFNLGKFITNTGRTYINPKYVPTSSSDVFNRLPDVPVRYSSIVQSNSAAIMENIAAPLAFPAKTAAIKSFIDSRKGRIITEILDQPVESVDPFTMVGLYRGQLKQAYDDLALASSNAAKVAISSAERNVVTETLEQGGKKVIVPVQGPIYQTQTIGFADKFLRQYSDDYLKVSESQLLDKVEAEFRPLVSQLRKVIQQGAVTDKNGALLRDLDGNLMLRPIPFKAAWENQRNALNIGFTSVTPGQIDSSTKRRTYRGLSQALDQDIRQSMTGWQNEGAQALQSYRYAKRLAQTRIQTHEQGDAINKLRLDNETGIKDVEKLFSNEVSVSRALAAGRSRQELGSFYVSNLFEKALQRGNRDIYDPNILRREWFNPNNVRVAKKLFSKEGEYQRLTDFVEYVIRDQEQVSQTGKVAAFIRITSGLAHLTGSLATGRVLTGGLSAGDAATMGIVGTYFSLNQFVKRVMLNDRAARAFSLLTHGPQTKEAQRNAARVIVGAMRGAPVLLQTANGALLEATVSSSGDFEVAPSSSPLLRDQ